MAAALASPSRIAPSSQTMDASFLSPPPHSTADSSSNHHSSRFSNSDFPASTLLKSEEYRQLFRLPSDEVLVQDFNCAAQENILLQGHMYVFGKNICFYSNIFGFELKKIIPFQDVTSVQRAKTAGIFPNAIEIAAAGKKHFFTSFLSRDEAFNLIVDGWLQNGNGPEGLLDQQDSKSEISSQLNRVSTVENGNSSDSRISDCDSDERNLEVSSSKDALCSPNHVDDDIRATSLEVPDIVEEKQDAVFVAGQSLFSQSASWNQETRGPSEIPKCFTKVVESKFPINVEQFYNHFFSDDAAGFVESYHKACGDKDFKCSSWKPSEKIGYVREKSFQHPIKVYLGAKCGGCKETQKYQVYKISHLVIETSQEVSDVPYADYFTVEGIWDVQKDDNEPEGCILQVYVSVAFSKKTIWKGKIEQSTMEECRETYATWINLAHKLLEQNNIEKTEGNIVEGGDQIDEQNIEENRDHVEGCHVNSELEIKTDTVMNKTSNHKQSEKLVGGSIIHATSISSTKQAFPANFCSFLKNRVTLKQFLVITFVVILLLMQLSIIMLLSRPPQVQVIPRADHLTSVGYGSGQRAAEAMVWMDKRVHLLKDEMLMVEAQLERMRHEHVLLEAQLKDLDSLLIKQQR
ncbi:protein VASCULAR ASSOCIATED DEATH 1, chloroplastic-like [Silene latifolia]|uniref:protein VASCULAR ASSOCIATED DEATH 1, chloroplastic-like n=1 Tax=Silene latifolia TaxID=37657 RepID=UPI003D77E152